MPSPEAVASAANSVPSPETGILKCGVKTGLKNVLETGPLIVLFV